jgi:tyrosyl-tRNA synthetase
MAAATLFRNTSRPDLYICARCALKASKPSRTARRLVHLNSLLKAADAERKWDAHAKLVRSGKKKSMLTILEERGLVDKFTGLVAPNPYCCGTDLKSKREAVEEVLTNRRIGAYVGVDPTAASLHVGNLAAFMPLFWMYIHGYHTVSLLGGATAKIGDPTDRLTSRKKEASSTRTANMANMHLQLKKLWVNVESYGDRYGYKRDWAWHRELLNNGLWWNKLPMLEVLQVLGPGMRMGSMLARETLVQFQLKTEI